VSDIARSVRALASAIETPPLSYGLEPLSPALAVLTCLLSIDGRSGEYIDQRISALQSPTPGYGLLASVRGYAELFPSPVEYFQVDLRDPGKQAHLLLPILDALIDGQRDFEGATEADRVRAWAEAARPSEWNFPAFRGLRLKGFQELRALLGANTIIPKKEHVAFVATVLGRKVDVLEALYLLERAAGRLRYNLNSIPESVWMAKDSSESSRTTVA